MATFCYEDLSLHIDAKDEMGYFGEAEKSGRPHPENVALLRSKRSEVMLMSFEFFINITDVALSLVSIVFGIYKAIKNRCKK